GTELTSDHGCKCSRTQRMVGIAADQVRFVHNLKTGKAASKYPSTCFRLRGDRIRRRNFIKLVLRGVRANSYPMNRVRCDVRNRPQFRDALIHRDCWLGAVLRKAERLIRDEAGGITANMAK